MIEGSDGDLAALMEKYPLPAEERGLEVFRQVVGIHTVSIQVAGVATTVDGECITGSAGSQFEPPLPRAYFELIERLAVLSAIRCADPSVHVWDKLGQRRAEVLREIVFPAPPARAGCSWARSSGVAVGETWHDAAERARCELVERDRVLRSWYGEHTPTRIPTGEDFIPAALRTPYEFEAHAFGVGGDGDEDTSVVGVFGFPRNNDDPLVYGFGARADLRSATACAAGECLQRLAFLWGEAIPEEPAPPAPTPDFHQEYYLCPKHRDRIRSWLSGEHRCFGGILDSRPAPPEVLYADLTPPLLKSRLRIAKAVPVHHVPLSFGRGHPMLRWEPPHELAVHPIV